MPEASPAERLAAWNPEIAIVLGSGLGSMVEAAATSETISYGEFPELPPSRVAGHSGRFVRGEFGGARVVFAQGRVHLYEGRSAHEVTAGVRVLHAAGVRRIILTNAAGSANRQFAPGTWMSIADHLNLTGTSPLVGRPEFIDMSDVYSVQWRRGFAAAAQATGVTLHEGVYAGLLGPQYETPAEVRMLHALGADAIGMSTVLEAIQARALGMEIAGFSCLTNWAAGQTGNEVDEPANKLSHTEVLEMGLAAAEQFERLLVAALAVPARERSG